LIPRSLGTNGPAWLHNHLIVIKKTKAPVGTTPAHDRLVRLSATVLVLALLGVVAPAEASVAGKLVRSVKQRAIALSQKPLVRALGWSLRGRQVPTNQLERQGFEHGGEVLSSIRLSRSHLATQKPGTSRNTMLTGLYGQVSVEDARNDVAGKHLATARLELGNEDGIVDRDYVSSISRGGPGGRIERALSVRSRTSFDSSGSSLHTIVDERRVGGLFKLERRADVQTRGGHLQQSTARTYFKLGRLKVPLPIKHMQSSEMEASLRRSAAPVGTGTDSAAPAPLERPVNIALGLRSTSARSSIDEFGERVGGVSYHAWHNYGLLEEFADNGKWSENLPKALHTAIDHGGRIKFDVTALRTTNRVTANELRLIRSNPKFRAHTDFYELDAEKQYRQLSDREVADVMRSVLD
jgi:hypothetical protein